MDPQLARLVEEFPDDVRVIYRHFPLTHIHDKAVIAAEAAEAAAAQGAFWEFHDALFERQSDFSATNADGAIGFLADLANDIGLDGEQLQTDLETGKYTAFVEAYLQEAANLRVTGDTCLND